MLAALAALGMLLASLAAAFVVSVLVAAIFGDEPLQM